MTVRATERVDRHAPGRQDRAVGGWYRLCHLILAAACLPWSLPAAQAAPGTVLFIGNSLTAANDLPAMVDSIGRGQGRTVTHEAIALPNFSLEDHWRKGDAVRAIARGGWSTVVLQQGPSALPESRALLRAFVRKFDAEARRVGARTGLYMVWPAAARKSDFDDVHRSYADAAQEVGGLFLPAGDAWQAAWRRDPTLALYGADGFHPTRLGSHVAALAIYAQLTDQAPASITRVPGLFADAFTQPGLAKAQAATIGDAAAEAVARARSRR